MSIFEMTPYDRFWSDSAVRQFLEMEALLHRIAPDHPEIHRYLALRALAGDGGGYEDVIDAVTFTSDQHDLSAGNRVLQMNAIPHTRCRFTGVVTEPVAQVGLEIAVNNRIVLGGNPDHRDYGSYTPAAIAQRIVFGIPVTPRSRIDITIRLADDWCGEQLVVRVLGMPEPPLL